MAYVFGPYRQISARSPFRWSLSEFSTRELLLGRHRSTIINSSLKSRCLINRRSIRKRPHADEWGRVPFATTADWVACTGHKDDSLAYTKSVRPRVGYSRYSVSSDGNGKWLLVPWLSLERMLHVRRTFTRVPGGPRSGIIACRGGSRLQRRRSSQYKQSVHYSKHQRRYHGSPF